MLDIRNTYWNGEGRLQKYYDVLKNVGANFTDAEKHTTYIYYRFYNDGDYPMGTKYVAQSKVQKYLEMQANIAIAKAYYRYTKGICDYIIKYFAAKKLQGFRAWDSATAV